MNSLNPSDRVACRIAGISYLLTFALVVTANFAIYNKLNVPGNITQTTQNILEHPSLFRLGVLLDVLYCIGFVSLTAMLYQVLKSVNQNLSLLALCWQLLYAAIWIVVTINVFAVLKGLNKFDINELPQLESSVKTFLGSRNDRYYGGLPFYALGATVFSYLMLTSGVINKTLAAISMLSCLWCLVCAILHFAIPNFSLIINLWLYDLPMALSQIVISIWLIIKSLK